MAALTFWGKPGCAGNARQIAALRASGHVVDVRDLRSETWTPGRLRAFFGDRPVTEWFNPAAPKVRQGAIRPETLSESQALAALIAEPLLIRRPLLAGAGRTLCGFDAGLIDAWVGLAADLPVINEGCVRVGMAPCPDPSTSPSGPSPPAVRSYIATVDQQSLSIGANSE